MIVVSPGYGSACRCHSFRMACHTCVYDCKPIAIGLLQPSHTLPNNNNKKSVSLQPSTKKPSPKRSEDYERSCFALLSWRITAQGDDGISHNPPCPTASPAHLHRTSSSPFPPSPPHLSLPSPPPNLGPFRYRTPLGSIVEALPQPFCVFKAWRRVQIRHAAHTQKHGMP